MIPCDTCGTLFTPDPSNHGRNTHNFCRRQCYYDFDDAPVYPAWDAPEHTLGYVAGFFDAEGHVGVSPNGARHLLTDIVNTHLGVIETIQRLFTPCVIPISVIPPARAKWNVTYRLVWQSNAAVVFLEALLPYL